MTDQDKQDIIKILMKLGFISGANAFWVTEKRWVTLSGDPYFLSKENILDNQDDYNVAHALVYWTDGFAKTVKISELESPHTAKNKIDVLIDDIKNNPSPVKETWVLQLEELKTWCDVNDAIKERRANQLTLHEAANEMNKKSHEVDDAELATYFWSIETYIRAISKKFDNPKITLNYQSPTIIKTSPTIKEKQNQIIAKIEDVLGRGAMYYSELTTLLNQLKESDG